MPVDKIRPNDPRVAQKIAILNGFTYGYLHSLPPPGTQKRGTIVLLHGFPDLSLGWRYQIPLFTSLGLEVIAPDCLGYGRSDAPGTHQISAYTYKRIAEDIATLCAQHSISEIILGGHDWGGSIVYRVAQLKPQLVKSVFSICTPYQMPRPRYMPLKQMVETLVPNFGYQLHFVSGEIEEAVQSPQDIRNFLNGMYGARTVEPDGSRGKVLWDAAKGVALNELSRMGKTKLLNDEEMDYYVKEYSRNGINGPLNWYRAFEARFLDDLDFFFSGSKTDPNDKKEIKVEQPFLFVLATKDAALQEWMSRGMDRSIPKLSRAKVEAGHWAFWEKPEEVNAILGKWTREVGLPSLKSQGGQSKL